MQNKANLLAPQMNVSSVKTKNYEQITMNYANKNKANTKPIRANLLAPQMNVSSVLTKYYENVPLRRHGQNKPKTNPTCSELACGEQGRSVEPISEKPK